MLLLLLAGLLASWSNSNDVDKKTKEVCSAIAPIRKREYKNTAWKDFDFYKSCIDNIKCTSPLKICK